MNHSLARKRPRKNSVQGSGTLAKPPPRWDSTAYTGCSRARVGGEPETSSANPLREELAGRVGQESQSAETNGLGEAGQPS